MRAGFLASLLACCVSLTPSVARAQSPDVMPSERYHVEFGTVWWQPDPELVIQTDALSGAGFSDFDFAQEFGFDTKRFPEFRVNLKPARKHKFRVSYVTVEYDQTSQLNRDITFDGTTFSGLVTANIRWNLWRFGYEWDFVSTNRGFFGMLADVKYNTVNAAVQSRVAAEATDASTPIPGLGVIGRYYAHPRIAISGEFTAFKLVTDVEGSFYEFDISATGNIFKSFGVVGGYRLVNADYIVDEDRGDLKLQGPYFGIVSRF